MEGSDPGAYAGSKTTLKITAAGCPNTTEDNLQTVIGFDETGPSQGNWGMDFFSFGEVGLLSGLYIERKIGKDLTLALSAESYAALLGILSDYVDDEATGCDLGPNGDDFDNDDFEVKKAQGTLSKNGDKIKVSIEVSGSYTNSDAQSRNLKLKIDGTMNFEFAAANPSNPPPPTPTATPTVTPTAEPSPTPTTTPSATPSATPTPNPSATSTSSPSATPTTTPSATPTPSPSATPTVSPTATPTATPSATPPP
jgi:hypothetical protein